jgi:hypothetical protein
VQRGLAILKRSLPVVRSTLLMTSGILNFVAVAGGLADPLLFRDSRPSFR